ncbi:LGFP repeat-containing protein, partial [Mycobacterium palustre]|nr:LGFP repeat-containing protein [Mycobacterium palustre]
MNGQRGRMRKRVGRALLGMATTAVAAGLLAPAAAASPIGDAEAAMMAAWDKAGGDTSPLGARKGDVYPAGDGFALDFDGGKMFYTTDTGAKFLYGPILDKYESQGGPAASDLGFPTINEVPGLAGPDSRVATFSASDKPVIFWTPDHGAFVVRGALNAAWDKLGSSGGVLGAPVGDATYDGDVTSQKFSGGEISWSRKTKEFTTTPPALGDQLKGLQVPIDPTAAINLAWRAAGGASGPLGAKQGGTYPIGGDGVAQNFAGGKVFFSPATGANALESDVLAKYESLGGPVGSDLGFPIANESDGGFGTSSRSAAFSAADKPVIFWTRDHGAFVVRGAIKAAWDKLRGPAGKLGAPVGDQAVTGDVFSQQFTGGKISWNRAKNTFSTDPSNLAPLLSGLQVSGQNQPSTAAMPAHGKKFTWHWWWLLAGVPVLLLALAALGAVGWRRRRRPPSDVVGYQREPA